jgi:MoaA/NifB/PqqE/SkfB family radical SAM enzyme
MFEYADLKSLHLEITNRCQASCPMCSRNYHGGLDNPLLKESDWNIDDFKNIVGPVVKQLDKINFCGNFGDPLLNADLQLMTDMLKQTNIHVDVHTNGSLRNDKWWTAFPRHLPASHRVIFAIDGLADTHSRYRIGTDFNRILDNAKTFIRNGGIAEWCFIRFKHNEHQVQAAQALANTYGFKYFSVKDSSRFNFETKFAVYNKQGKTEYYLEPPTYHNIKKFDVSDLADVEEFINASDIDCFAKHNFELYIDAHKRIMPCCFLAAIPYDYYRVGDILHLPKDVIKQQYRQLINELGDTQKSIQEVLESDSFQNVWQKYWTINKLWTCARTCGSIFNRPNDQIQSYQVL